MSKRQVLAMSLLVAIPGAFTVFLLVMGALTRNIAGGTFWGVWGTTGLLAVFGAALLPIWIAAFYPAEGFAVAGPAPADPAEAPGSNASNSGDDELDDFEDDFEEQTDSGEALFDEDELDDFDDDDDF